MATPRELFSALSELIDHQAKGHANAPTRVVPGYHASVGLTVTEDGRIAHVGSAGGGGLRYLTYSQTIASGDTDRINYDTMHFEEGLTGVTTGVGSWVFTAAVETLYVISASVLFNTASWSTAETCVLSLVLNGTVVKTHWHMMQAANSGFPINLHVTDVLFFGGGGFNYIYTTVYNGRSGGSITVDLATIAIAMA